MEAPGLLPGLSLGLSTILLENGGAWSVTKYLTLCQIMQPMAEALGLLPGRHYNPRPGLGMCDTLTLDQWDLRSSPRLSYSWLRPMLKKSASAKRRGGP